MKISPLVSASRKETGGGGGGEIKVEKVQEEIVPKPVDAPPPKPQSSLVSVKHSPPIEVAPPESATDSVTETQEPKASESDPVPPPPPIDAVKSPTAVQKEVGPIEKATPISEVTDEEVKPEKQEEEKPLEVVDDPPPEEETKKEEEREEEKETKKEDTKGIRIVLDKCTPYHLVLNKDEVEEEKKEMVITNLKKIIINIFF